MPKTVHLQFGEGVIESFYNTFTLVLFFFLECKLCLSFKLTFSEGLLIFFFLNTYKSILQWFSLKDRSVLCAIGKTTT